MEETNAHRRAAEYVRMSTDHQRYSIDNQKAAIGVYARQRGFEVVRTFADSGKSGVTIKNRHGLKELLRLVIAGDPGFVALLVYDVSRWGRFQDTDEAAHYEFLCRSNGVQVIYCAEPFENDATPLSAVLKSIKRAMAAEYSREMSVKISAALRRLALEGFYVGGRPGFGLRRLLTDAEGKPKSVMEQGSSKNIREDRVRWTLGPSSEVATIREIFALFIDKGLSYGAIAARLNKAGRERPGHTAWNAGIVRKILAAEKYAGVRIINRYRSKLSTKPRFNPPEDWIRLEGTVPPIVTPSRFATAQTMIACRQATDEVMLENLRRVFRKHGKITRELVAAAGLPSYSRYRTRFGSILEAYRRIGYEPPSGSLRAAASRLRGLRPDVKPDDAQPSEADRFVDAHYETDETLLAMLQDLLRRQGEITRRLIDHDPVTPSATHYRTRFGSLVAAYELIGYEPTSLRAKLTIERIRRRRESVA